MLINAANDGAKAMKSKREKQLIALGDSQGCLEFWTKFGASLRIVTGTQIGRAHV